MLELPEVINLTRQLRENVVGRNVVEVLPPTKEHKFCGFNGDVRDYDRQIRGTRIASVNGFGLFVELCFDNGRKLCLNDGINLRLLEEIAVPKDYQLRIKLDCPESLVFTVAMYGGIILHHDDFDNAYYLRSRQALSPFDSAFPDYFRETFHGCKPTLSAKAFMATEQRFPGIVNGVLQDILFTARIHPKRKIGTLSGAEQNNLLHCTVDVLQQMTDQGGRDTEKDLFGKACGYKTLLSKNTLERPCPRCGGTLVKEAYLGGAVYYCRDCQQN